MLPIPLNKSLHIFVYLSITCSLLRASYRLLKEERAYTCGRHLAKFISKLKNSTNALTH